jgi:tetratricopeptide (TPR) repeat protein
MTRVLLLALALCGTMFANDAASAQKSYFAKQWSVAADQYQKLTQSEPGNALYWYRLGTSLRMAGELTKAEAALQKSIDLGFQKMYATVGLAAVYAQGGQSEKALTLLEGLAKNGAPAAPIIEGDDAFKKIGSEPRFINVIESMKEQAAPCKYHEKHPKYREFDFWLGDWDVFGKAGNPAGHSHVELMVGDCVLNENWTDLMGGVGKSYNKYNPPLKRWEQYWVDQYGATTYYVGNLEGPNMVFLADGLDRAGKPQKLRMTFFPLEPGKVRQFGEVSTDDGKTWSTSFDLIYVRHTNGTQNSGK